MNKGYLSGYFTGAGTKTLTRVDATSKSNQHEIGDGERGEVLMRILGNQPRKQNNRFVAKYLWLSGEQETVTADGFLSWYDTREKQAHRAPEWRLYYQTNDVTDLMTEGDRLFVARRPDDTVLFIVIPQGSPLVGQVLWLFGLDAQQALDGFSVNPVASDTDGALDFIARFVLDELGIEYEDPDANTLDTIIERFGYKFPTTAVFSDLARLTLPGVDARDNPDAALMAWLDHEEALFRRLENRVVTRDLEKGWALDGKADVDGFIKYSLGVQNRRKSRMGHSFEHHLRAVFDALEINYDHQVRTEKGKRPDFIFPGKPQYYDPDFATGLLTHLAAKSTCKDRWPQILPEAERIPAKHLVTLEPSITEPQTTMMKDSGVQLVAPQSIHQSYSSDQRDWLWTLGDFTTFVTEKQNASI